MVRDVAARQRHVADGDDDRPNCWLCEEMTGTTAVASAEWSIARMTWDKLKSKQAHGKPHCPVPKGQTWQAPKVWCIAIAVLMMRRARHLLATAPQSRCNNGQRLEGQHATARSLVTLSADTEPSRAGPGTPAVCRLHPEPPRQDECAHSAGRTTPNMCIEWSLHHPAGRLSAGQSSASHTMHAALTPVCGVLPYRCPDRRRGPASACSLGSSCCI
jgi:hypothetical protein